MKKKMYAEVATIYDKDESSLHEIVKEEKEMCASLAIMPPTTTVTASLHDKCLVKAEKALSMRVEARSRKRVPTDGKVLRQRALRLHEDSSKRSPGTSDGPFTASEGWPHRLGSTEY